MCCFNLCFENILSKKGFKNKLLDWYTKKEKKWRTTDWIKYPFKEKLFKLRLNFYQFVLKHMKIRFQIQLPDQKKKSSNYILRIECTSIQILGWNEMMDCAFINYVMVNRRTSAHYWSNQWHLHDHMHYDIYVHVFDKCLCPHRVVKANSKCSFYRILYRHQQ